MMAAPLSQWPADEMREKAALIRECLMTFGMQAARELMRKLGLPGSPEIWDGGDDPDDGDFSEEE